MNAHNRQALVVCGLGYGDECKGSITDYLARVHKAHTVVRYNGGAQAAHNVVLSDGRSHTFSQFGSATFIPQVRTHLSRFMLVNPIGMLIEADRLTTLGIRDACTRTTIDEQALIVTPFHVAMNRLRELSRGERRHGSCGQGIGETVSDAKEHPELAIHAGDLTDTKAFMRKLHQVQEFKASQMNCLSSIPDDQSAIRERLILTSPDIVDGLYQWYGEFSSRVQIVPSAYLESITARNGTVIFEGAQGVLLDEACGFHPHVTSTATTLKNAETLLSESDYDGEVVRYGLFRSYFTRHGHGPFVTEDSSLSSLLPDNHNGTHEWQSSFRVGWFDIPAAKYALSCAGKVDSLIFSCVDRTERLETLKVCTEYEYKGTSSPKILVDASANGEPLTSFLNACKPVYQTNVPRNTREYLRFLAHELDVPVSIISDGPTERSKRPFAP